MSRSKATLSHENRFVNCQVSCGHDLPCHGPERLPELYSTAATLQASPDSSWALLYVSHYVWVIFAFQVIGGLLPADQPLRAVGGGDIGAGDQSQHPHFPRLDGSQRLPVALFAAILWAAIFIEVRPAFSGLFQSQLAAAGLTAEERKNMSKDKLTVVVTGATGKQGSAVAQGAVSTRPQSTRRHARPEFKARKVPRGRWGIAGRGFA